MRISDWSSDVCSSDLPQRNEDGGRCDPEHHRFIRHHPAHDETSSCLILPSSRSRRPRATWPRSGRGSSPSPTRDRKSVVEGKSVSVRVDLGGGRIIKKKKEERMNNVCRRNYSR